MEFYISKPGVMCCAGTSLEELWTSVITGNQKGIKKVKTETNEEFYAARIDDDKLSPTTARLDMKVMRIEEAALNQIADDIEAVKSKYGPDRIAVCIGSCDNCNELAIAGHKAFFKNEKFPENYTLEMQGADYVATFISEKYGITGPSATYSTACSSSAGAVIKGAEMIQAGIVDAAIVGGIDMATDTVLIGFNALEAVSPDIINPFSKNRTGITLGEAGAFFVLTKEPLSSNVQLLGWGESSDAYHMTSPDPSGAGAEKAIRRALESAKLEPKDVDYINMHGTGTKLNDSMESKAIDAVFGDYKVPVSTTKAVTGHTLGAAAALELAVCYSAVNNIGLPIQVWDKEQDPELPVLNIIDEKNDKKARICLSNSFGFGGANACLAIGIKEGK